MEPRGNESKHPVKPDVQQSAADEARNTVRSAVESNPVLSNLVRTRVVPQRKKGGMHCLLGIVS